MLNELYFSHIFIIIFEQRTKGKKGVSCMKSCVRDVGKGKKVVCFEHVKFMMLYMFKIFITIYQG